METDRTDDPRTGPQGLAAEETPSSAEQVTREGAEPLRLVTHAGDAHPSPYGGLQSGLPASGATSQPDQALDAGEDA